MYANTVYWSLTGQGPPHQDEFLGGADHVIPTGNQGGDGKSEQIIDPLTGNPKGGPYSLGGLDK